jgi:hypothetical protein
LLVGEQRIEVADVNTTIREAIHQITKRVNTRRWVRDLETDEGVVVVQFPVDATSPGVIDTTESTEDVIVVIEATETEATEVTEGVPRRQVRGVILVAQRGRIRWGAQQSGRRGGGITEVTTEVAVEGVTTERVGGSQEAQVELRDSGSGGTSLSSPRLLAAGCFHLVVRWIEDGWRYTRSRALGAPRTVLRHGGE